MKPALNLQLFGEKIGVRKNQALENCKILEEGSDFGVLKSLAPIQIQVLMRRFYLGQSRKKIAEELGKSVSGIAKIEREGLNTILNRVAILKTYPKHPGFTFIAKKKL